MDDGAHDETLQVFFVHYGDCLEHFAADEIAGCYSLPSLADTFSAATGRIATVQVNWAYREASDRPFYDCDFRYVLRVEDNGDLRIRVVIAINEVQRLAAFLGRR